MKASGRTGFLIATALWGLTIDFSVASAQDTTRGSDGDPAEIANEIAKQLTDAFKQYDAQLQAVLKTRFPQEKSFVNQVVLMVQEEKIPKNIVDSAWLWVRKNRPNTRYPFVYFERVLRLEGEKLKIKIPPFDRNLYSQPRFTSGFQSGVQSGFQSDIHR
jgi:hypothetical protein